MHPKSQALFEVHILIDKTRDFYYNTIVMLRIVFCNQATLLV